MSIISNYSCTSESVQQYLNTVIAASGKFSDAIATYTSAAQVKNPFNYEREVIQETFITPLEYSKDIKQMHDRDLIIGLAQTATIFADKAFNFYFSNNAAKMHSVDNDAFIDICDKAGDALMTLSTWADHVGGMFENNPELLEVSRTAYLSRTGAALEGIFARIDVGVMFVALGRFFDCVNLVSTDIGLNYNYSLSDVLKMYVDTLKYFGVFTTDSLFI